MPSHECLSESRNPTPLRGQRTGWKTRFLHGQGGNIETAVSACCGVSTGGGHSTQSCRHIPRNLASCRPCLRGSSSYCESSGTQTFAQRIPKPCRFARVELKLTVNGQSPAPEMCDVCVVWVCFSVNWPRLRDNPRARCNLRESCGLTETEGPPEDCELNLNCAATPAKKRSPRRSAWGRTP